jgi:hypothetical protein
MSKFDGFFVSSEVHERTVKLSDGSEHVLHFRELPVTEFRRFQMAERSDDEEVRIGSQARLIAAGLCEPDGSPSMTYDEARQLKPAVASALVVALMDVNRPKPGNA